MIILFGITFAFPLFGIRNIIPSRWFAFEYFFVSVFAAFAIIQLSHLTNKIVLKKVFVLFVFCMMAFFMPASTISNSDSPLWLEDSTISTTYTPAEIRGAETINHYSDNLFSDARFGADVLGVYLSEDSIRRDKTKYFLYKKQIFNRRGDILLWRNYMLNRPISLSKTVKEYNRTIIEANVLGANTLKILDSKNKVYDNKNIIGYYIL